MLHSHQMSKPAGRRAFLKTVALAAAAPTKPATSQTPTPSTPPPPKPITTPHSPMRYPRIYTGRQLAMLAMPLGGIAAGSISLGGRGQLRDWEIFNRPDKGRSPEYAFASIWAQAGRRKPAAHVLEARLMPPYEGPDGLGSKNAPGLSRLEGAAFTGEFPIRPRLHRLVDRKPHWRRLSGCRAAPPRRAARHRLPRNRTHQRSPDVEPRHARR